MKVKKNFFKFSRIYFLIIILFLYSFNSFSIIGICKDYEINTLFVGGTGDKNYSRIQEAVDDAKENETVIVFEGIYNESIVVNKSIKLIGLDKNNVFVNGSDNLYVFLIKSSYVNISGFTIQGGKIGIYVSGSEFLFNNFSGNNISKNIESMRFVNTSNNKVFDNIIQSYGNFGIVLYDSCNNNISDNFFINNGKALYMNRWSNENIINKNNLTENDIGVSIEFCFNNIINENYFGNNNYGIYLTNSNFNNITNNIIEFNIECGIYISSSDNNTIIPNIFLENNQDIRFDTKPPEIKAPGFEFLFFFVAIFLFLCIKRYI